jgi:hypothetical protein
MTRTRFHHLTVCLLCCLVCSLVQTHYVMFVDWEWWAMTAIFVYAVQPIINIQNAWIVSKWPKRKPRDLYRLVGE